jgi:16S rRNA (uracil1498-N3)-methyltransferase
LSLRLFVGPLPGAAAGGDEGLSLAALAAGATVELPPAAARHAQVRRVQPGDVLALFDGSGSDWPATVLAMGRQRVSVHLGAAQPVACELPRAVTLALGMPANERMDTLVEKATELGAAAIQPLVCERSVLRLDGERAQRRRAHWQAVAVAAAEQCGRAVVPVVAPVRALPAWLQDAAGSASQRLVLHPADGTVPLTQVPLDGAGPLWVLSGPEGGLGPTELQAAQAAGFCPTGLGPRVLRADTAPLAVLAWLGLRAL